MEIYDYTVEKEESGIRIDRYLAEKDSGLSRSFLQKLLKEGQITVGEKAAKSNYKVRENDRIHLEIPDSSEPDIVPEDIPLDILWNWPWSSNISGCCPTVPCCRILLSALSCKV